MENITLEQQLENCRGYARRLEAELHNAHQDRERYSTQINALTTERESLYAAQAESAVAEQELREVYAVAKSDREAAYGRLNALQASYNSCCNELSLVREELAGDRKLLLEVLNHVRDYEVEGLANLNDDLKRLLRQRNLADSDELQLEEPFLVHVKFVARATVEIQATDEQDARDKAADYGLDDVDLGEVEYDEMHNVNFWDVEKARVRP